MHQVILLIGTSYTVSLLHFTSGYPQANHRPSYPVDITHMWPCTNSCFGDQRTKNNLYGLQTKDVRCSIHEENENYEHESRWEKRFRITWMVDEEQ